MGKKMITIGIALWWICILFPAPVKSAPSNPDKERLLLYQGMEAITGIPWFYLAAVDQYERNLRRLHKDRPEEKGLIAIDIPPRRWSGPFNPDPEDTVPASIRFFGGIGRDADGDGKADPDNDMDALYSFARHLAEFGHSRDDIRMGLWKYYRHPAAVDIITHMARIYETFGSLDLKEHHFPIPLHYNYTYRSTWGDRRGWGGLRIHEGTDIFADYGTPVLATCYGYVELMGWNQYGGWRVGIRDLHNNYHYYGHLNGFNKEIKQGDVVKPGTVIGYVGSSGYGPPGTAGKFPPHLHFGLYTFNGSTTYSVDPYPRLHAWERETRERLQKQQKQRQKASPGWLPVPTQAVPR
ncbi:MAG: M23 family metallopeptidase [Planifilum sp.]|jgi:hypothetical protein